MGHGEGGKGDAELLREVIGRGEIDFIVGDVGVTFFPARRGAPGFVVTPRALGANEVLGNFRIPSCKSAIGIRSRTWRNFAKSASGTLWPRSQCQRLDDSEASGMTRKRSCRRTNPAARPAN